MSVAVVGASGLIGSAVATKLGGTRRVVTIGRRAPADRLVDLSEPDSLRALDLSGCEALVHCAGVVDEDIREDAARAFRHATAGMAALVEGARRSGVKRFAYISSAHVYGPLQGAIDETSPTNPLSDYARAHFASEQILRAGAGPATVAAVFRPCAVFGMPPDLARFRRWGLVPFSFPRDAVTKGRIALQSHGLQRRNFVGTEDIADAVETWLDDAEAKTLTAINPIGAATMTVREFANLCAGVAGEVMGRRCEVSWPEPTGALEPPLDYRTRDARYIGTADLAGAIRSLMQRLRETRP